MITAAILGVLSQHHLMLLSHHLLQFLSLFHHLGILILPNQTISIHCFHHAYKSQTMCPYVFLPGHQQMLQHLLHPFPSLPHTIVVTFDLNKPKEIKFLSHPCLPKNGNGNNNGNASNPIVQNACGHGEDTNINAIDESNDEVDGNSDQLSPHINHVEQMFILNLSPDKIFSTK